MFVVSQVSRQRCQAHTCASPIPCSPTLSQSFCRQERLREAFPHLASIPRHLKKSSVLLQGQGTPCATAAAWRNWNEHKKGGKSCSSIRAVQYLEQYLFGILDSIFPRFFCSKMLITSVFHSCTACFPFSHTALYTLSNEEILNPSLQSWRWWSWFCCPQTPLIS